jgi:hypothetical protein
MFLVRKTVPAPSAVIAQVNRVAINACRIGERDRNLSMIMVDFFLRVKSVYCHHQFSQSTHALRIHFCKTLNPLYEPGTVSGDEVISSIGLVLR